MNPKKKLKATKASPKEQRNPKAPSVTRKSKELRIRFANSHQLLDMLHTEAHSVSLVHSYQLLTKGGGRARTDARLSTADIGDGPTTQTAIDLVTNCAGDTDLSATLGDIPGLDPVIFQSCVQSAATAAGFKPTSIPASSGTKLSDVVQAVVGSPK
jgi:hypothetical protein